MTRLSNSDEPAPGDQLPQGASRPARARTTDRPPSIVDVSGESLSAFASEHELTARQAPAPAREPARPRSTTVPFANAAPPAAPPRPRPAYADWRARPVVPVLSAVVLVESLLLAWLWFAPGAWPHITRSTSSVTITSEPAGAEISIDGQGRGTTPITLAVASGRHQLQVGTDGSAWTQTVEVTPGESSSLHVVQAGPALARQQAAERGTIDVTTEPAGLAVAVDGRRAGVSPISVSDLQPGAHVVTVTRGTAVTRRTVSVEAGIPTAVLIATGDSGIASGWLAVTSPVPVRIIERGTLLGTSETPRLLLTVGRHDLEFVNDTFGYHELRTVQVAAGTAASVGLAPANGTLSVNAQPWGEVWVDGKRIGETPIGNLTLPIGNHDVLVRHPQLGERRRTVAVSANAPARIGIDLRQ